MAIEYKELNPFSGQLDATEDGAGFVKLDQTEPQTITGDTPKLDVLKSKTILGTDSDGKIIEGTHQDLSGYVPYTGATDDVDLGNNDLETTGDIIANSFITDSGASSDFVKGDGSLDSSPYITGVGWDEISGTQTDISLSGFNDDLSYEVPLTFSTGLTRTTNTITINTTQNITNLSNLTSNGFVVTSGGDGTLGIDTTTYLDTTTAGTTYVPYTGATSDVDLGSYDLETTGSVQAEHLQATDDLEVADDIIINSGLLSIEPSGSYSDGGYYINKGTGKMGGLVTELYGQILTLGHNCPQVGTRDTSRTGGIFRLDMRSGNCYNCFVIYSYPRANEVDRDGNSAMEAFKVNLESGDTYINHHPDLGGTTVIGEYPTCNPTPDAQLTVNGDIHLYQDGDKLFFGAGKDASIYYDETNLIINPKEVGSGILDVQGVLQTDGYNSADGTAGISTTFVDADGNTITVKDGLITAKTAS
jgi:hypothetical protein